MDLQMNNNLNEKQQLIEYFSHQIFQLQYNKQHNLVPKIQNKIKNILTLKNLDATLKKNQYIGEDGCEKIGRSLVFFNQILTLNLSISRGNNISNKGLQYISEGLKSLIQLEKLKITLGSHNKVNEEGIKNLSEAIQTMKNLKQVSIKIYNNPISTAGFNHIQYSIQHLKLLSILKFHFVNTDLNSESLINLGQAIGRIESITKLKVFISNQKGLHADGIQGLFNGIQNLNNLKNLKLKLALISYDYHEIDSLTCFSLLNNIEILYLDIPFIQSLLFQELYHQKILQNLKTLSIYLNNYFNKNDLQTMSECFQFQKNLCDLTINFECRFQRHNKKKISIDDARILLIGLEKCMNLHYLIINTNTPYDYLFLSLLQDLKQMKRFVFQRNSTAIATKEEISGQISGLILHYSSYGMYKEFVQFQNMAESITRLSYLKSLVIDLKDNKSILFENDNSNPHLQYDYLINEWCTTPRVLKQITKQSIKSLVDVIQKHENLSTFEFTILDTGSHYNNHSITGKRTSSKQKYNVTLKFVSLYRKETLPQLLFMSEILKNLGGNVKELNLNLHNYYLFNRTYAKTIGEQIRYLSFLENAEISIHQHESNYKVIQLLEEYFISLKYLKCFKLKFNKAQKRKNINYQIYRKNNRLVIYQ